MKAVMISIRPEWVEKILSGKKTVEIRKTAPKLKPPFRCYIYCTMEKPGRKHQYEAFGINGKPVQCGGYVVAEFICDKIKLNRTELLIVKEDAERALVGSCLTRKEAIDYLRKKSAPEHCDFYGWHITNLKIYDKPKELHEFNQCHKCEYNEGCVQHEYSCPGCYKLQRPPQSWCYVEELQ